MFYIVYKTTHVATGKYYFGMHSTPNVDDGYLGSGTWIKRAVKKYGPAAFKREVLHLCSSYAEMQDLERIVIARHINDELCLNIALGGRGGWHAVNSDPNANEWRRKGGKNGGAWARKHGMPQGCRYTSETAKENAQRMKELYGSDFFKKIGSYVRSSETRRKLAEASLGKKLMNDGIVAKWVEPDLVQQYMEEGWVLGRRKRMS